MLVVVLFMFRKRKGESLHLYVSYDGYTMAEKFILMTISFPQALKTSYLKWLQKCKKEFDLNSMKVASQKRLFPGKYIIFVQKRIWDTP